MFGKLAVLSVVHVDREEKSRAISFRRASKEESEIYREWLKNDFNT